MAIMNNELDELLEDIKMSIRNTLDDEWKEACQDYDFEYAEEHEAYGDTYVSSGMYITERSDAAFRQDFEESNDPNEFIDKLKLNPEFCSLIRDLVKTYTNNEELS